MSNIALFCNKQHELYLAESGPQRDARPEPDQVLIHVRSTGLCMSDCHYWKHGGIGDFKVTEPLILGHETAGEIIAVGSNVTNVKVGDRVAVEPGQSCTTCECCTSGHYNGCKAMQFAATPPYDGTMRRYILHPARLVFKLGNLTYDQGALLEPLSVALAAVKHSGLGLGEPTFICGAGPIGIVSALMAHAAGAAPLFISDIVSDRLELVKKMVPGIQTFQVDPKKAPRETANEIVEAAGTRFARVIECIGFESSLFTAIYSCAFGATVEVIGLGQDFVEFPLAFVGANELRVQGLFRYSNTWPTAIRLLNEGLVNADAMVTHRFKLEDAVKGFETFMDKSAKAIKVIIYDDSE